MASGNMKMVRCVQKRAFPGDKSHPKWPIKKGSREGMKEERGRRKRMLQGAMDGSFRSHKERKKEGKKSRKKKGKIGRAVCAEEQRTM